MVCFKIYFLLPIAKFGLYSLPHARVNHWTHQYCIQTTVKSSVNRYTFELDVSSDFMSCKLRGIFMELKEMAEQAVKSIAPAESWSRSQHLHWAAHNHL